MVAIGLPHTNTGEEWLLLMTLVKARFEMLPRDFPGRTEGNNEEIIKTESVRDCIRTQDIKNTKQEG
jgi:hypothetical protein